VIKVCGICNKEFETNYPNKKYCSKECSREAIREADRLRKRKEWDIKRKKQSDEERERIRLKREKIEKDAQERARERQSDLKKRLKEGDPRARMEVAKPNSFEYWEAYRQEFLEDEHNKTYIRYVNDISVYDDDFASRVVESIKELGYISSRLNRIKKHDEE
jgi:hypothetical protein